MSLLAILALAATGILAILSILLIAYGDLHHRPSRVPPAHPRQDTIAILDRTGDQVNQTVFPPRA